MQNLTHDTENGQCVNNASSLKVHRSQMQADHQRTNAALIWFKFTQNQDDNQDDSYCLTDTTSHPTLVTSLPWFVAGNKFFGTRNFGNQNQNSRDSNQTRSKQVTWTKDQVLPKRQ